MTEIIRSIVLGVVQGLTEFLPVSSSGHLEIAKFLMNNQNLDEHGLLMTVVLHFATALSTLVIFRKDVLEIVQGVLKFEWNDHVVFCLKIVISMIPVVIIGLKFDKEIETLFDQRIVLVGFMLIVTGILLFFADRAKNTDKPVNFVNAFIIGISQAIAILPGISRSGATISTSVLLGIDREKAARFSFLMVVPVIFGKMAKDILDGFSGEAAAQQSVDITALIFGFFAAFVTGLLACTWMIRLVKSSKLFYFSVYCFVIAIWAIITGLIQ